MSERDQYNEQAERLIEHCRYCDRLSDNRYPCAQDHADSLATVATKLRQQAKRIERLEAALANALAELHHNFGCDAQCIAQRHVEG